MLSCQRVLVACWRRLGADEPIQARQRVVEEEEFVVVRGTSCTNLATVLLLTLLQEMVTSQYFNEWTTLAAPFSSTLIFNTARPQEDFKELLEDEAFQRPCGTLSFSLKHTHTHLSLTQTHTHTYTHLGRGLATPLRYTHALSHTGIDTHTHTPQTRPCSALAVSNLTHSLTHSNTHTHTHTHTHTPPSRVSNLSHTHSSLDTQCCLSAPWTYIDTHIDR
jgi:hypothetical protein